ncbi:hypothetical protein NL676_009481 [Syzygium grande]|nr:hypothetical protein NL676_009481 [Syzygium grande]
MPHIIDPLLLRLLLLPPPDLPNPRSPNAGGHQVPHEFDSIGASTLVSPCKSRPFTCHCHAAIRHLILAREPELMARLHEPNYYRLLGPGDDTSELVDGEGFPPNIPLFRVLLL